MAKPSIFSREYERKMRKRKIRIASAIIIIILASVVIYMKGAYKNYIKDIFLNNSSTAQTNKDTKNNSNSTTQPPKTETKNEVQEKAFDLVLTNGTKVKALYEEKQGVNVFKSIECDNAAISFISNPSGTALVLLDSKEQSLWAVDGSGNLTEITNPSYKSYKKASVLSNRPSYIWCTSPKFIDDENIVYLSQLPRIANAPKLFVWSVNIKNRDSHIYNYGLSGENLKLGNVVNGKLEVNMGSTTKYITVSNSKILVVDQ